MYHSFIQLYPLTSSPDKIYYMQPILACLLYQFCTNIHFAQPIVNINYCQKSVTCISDSFFLCASFGRHLNGLDRGKVESREKTGGCNIIGM